jgi:uncharacterized phiE125 gp8 family phage protein
MMRSLTLKEPPAAELELVTLAAAKAQLRVTDNVEDALIQELIQGAFDAVNGPRGLLGRAIFTSTWEMLLDCWPDGDHSISVPLPPLQQINTISYVDPDGVTQTLDPEEYLVIARGESPSIVFPAYGTSWPSVRIVPGAIKIEFVAGWEAAADVPALIKRAAATMIAEWFDNRSQGDVPNAAHNLLRPLVVDIGGRWVG